MFKTQKLGILAKRLWRASGGATIIEFALVFPVFILLVLGIFDFSWQFYAMQVLNGEASQLARNSTLEQYSADQTALDDEIKKRVQAVFKNANVTIVRKSYTDFASASVGLPEPTFDGNGDGIDNCFIDVNGNGTRDQDQGTAGNGGPDDIVLHTIEMEITRVLPVWSLLGQPQVTTVSASAATRNQPFGTQNTTFPEICS